MYYIFHNGHFCFLPGVFATGLYVLPSAATHLQGTETTSLKKFVENYELVTIDSIKTALLFHLLLPP